MTARKLYHEPVPAALVARFWEQGEISPFQLMRVVAWKSAQPLAELSLNDEDMIRDRTRAAMRAIGQFRGVNVVTQQVDWQVWRDAAATAIGAERAGTGLLGLRGVRYPVATAILAVLLPEVFPVMDRYAIAGVFGCSVKEGASAKWHRADKYRDYCQLLAACERADVQQIRSVHERDQFFMNAAIERRL
jgi:hypothetical protein